MFASLFQRFSTTYVVAALIGFFAGIVFKTGFELGVKELHFSIGTVLFLFVFGSIAYLASASYVPDGSFGQRMLGRALGGFVFGAILVPLERLLIDLVKSNAPSIYFSGEMRFGGPIVVLTIGLIISVIVERLIVLVIARFVGVNRRGKDSTTMPRLRHER